MSRGKNKKKHGGGRPVTTDPSALTAELADLAQAISSAPAEAGARWGAAHKLLLKLKADPGAVARVIAMRDGDALLRLVAALRGEEVTEAPEPAAPAPVSHDIPAETLKKAMRAFRKRLKLVRLDHESRLGVGPMTSGRKADVDAIIPPMEFPREVWDALVMDGRLKPMGTGFYGPTDDTSEE